MKVCARSTGLIAQEISVVRRTDHADMAIAVDWDIKHQTKPNQNNGYPDQMFFGI